VALVGEVVHPLPTLPEGMQVFAMVDRFGVERALADPCGCAVAMATEVAADFD